MGKLKSSLTSLATLADAIEKKGDKALSDLQARATSVREIGGRVAGGYELLYMYLKQKAISKATKIEAWQNDALQVHIDAKVSEFIANIEQARKELLAVFKTYDDTANLLISTLNADIDRASAFGKDIEAQIAKKKKKLLQSAKFKTKIAGYETSLHGLEGKLATLKVDVSGLKDQTQSMGPKKIASLQITTGTTVAAVLKVANYGLVKELDEIKEQKTNKRLAIKLKAYGNELKNIRSWVNEADAMESESEEK